MNTPGYDKIYSGAWWLCVVTLPFTIPVNSFFIIVLAATWIAEGHLSEKWQRLKNAAWVWPFILFFTLHLAGLLYTQDIQAGFFEIEKKLSFVVIPVIAASGRPLVTATVDFLKKGFIYACLVIVVISLVFTTAHVFNNPGLLPQNFDSQTNLQFHSLNPDVSYWWENFSYIQVGDWIDIHPAYFSMYLILGIAILLQGMLEDKRIKYSALAIAILFLSFIVLLSSRMAIVTLPCVIFYLAYHYIPGNHPQLIAITCTLFILLLSSLIWVNPVSRFRIIQEPLQTSFLIDKEKMEWNSVSLRLLEWKASLSAIEKSWLVGVGTGDGQTELENYYSSFNSSTVGLNYNSHNQYLQTALELGVAGVLTLLICLLPSLLTSIRNNPLHVAFIILFGFMCFTESVLARQKGIVFFTIFQSIFLRSPVTP